MIPVYGPIGRYLRSIRINLQSEFFLEAQILLKQSEKAESFHRVKGHLEKHNGDWISEGHFNSEEEIDDFDMPVSLVRVVLSNIPLSLMHDETN